MKRLQLLTPLIFLCLISACGGAESVEPNKNLFGTWVETQTKGEVVFREDETVNWRGTEGTYEFLQDTGWSCWDEPEMPGSSETCHYRISITLGDRTIKILGHGPTRPRKEPLNVGFRQLFKKGSFEFPLMPSHFERVPDKLASGSHNEADVFDPTTLILGAGFLKRSSNQLISARNLSYYPENHNDHLYRFDNNRNQWIALEEFNTSGDYRIFNVTPQLISQAAGSNYNASLDGGITWKSLPVPERAYDHDSYPIVEILGTNIFFLNREWEQRQVGPQNLNHTFCTQEKLWMLNAEDERPDWALRNTFNSGCRYINPFLDLALVSRTDSWTDDGERESSFLISYDQGLTWDDSTTDHYYGNNDGYTLREKTLQWYDVDTQTWTTHTVDFWNVLGVTPNRDGLYFERWQEMYKWSPDGTETLITTLPSDNFEASVVGNDLYVSTIFGLWRMDL